MLPGLATSEIYSALYGDAQVANCLSDRALVRAMLRVEAALAQVQAELGVVPKDEGAALASELAQIDLTPSDLAQGTAIAGVPVPALVGALRARLSEGPAQWLHWGATSQDILDTAWVLMLRDVLEVIAPRLVAVVDHLDHLSHNHADLVMAGRTRGQVSTPVTFGLRCARWAQPLIGVEARMPAMRATLSRVQFGGASGANSAIAPHGPQISAALAEALGLQDGPSWHTDRTPFQVLAVWAQDAGQSLSKMAGDIILMMRSEVAEVSAGPGGGSSTMPHKSNPVEAEAIIALAAHIRHGAAMLAEAAIQAEERDGTTWPLEWSALPQITLALAAALRHAEALLSRLEPQPDAMARTLQATPGVMAEAASFALARHIPRDTAKAQIAAALSQGRPLAEVLKAHGIKEDALDPRSVIPAARAEADKVWTTRHRWNGAWT